MTARKDFLDRVAQRIQGFDPLTTVVVLPNRRAGLFLKKALAKRHNKPIFTPKIWTIEEYFFALSQLNKVEPTEQLVHLYNAYKKNVANKAELDTFDQFLNWGPTFLSDCNEIDTNLIDVKQFFDTLFHDREIRNWNVADDRTTMQERYLAFWKNAYHYYSSLTAELLAQGKAYNGLAYREAINHLPQNIKQLGFGQHVFVGFNALNQAEYQLFDFVAKEKCGFFIWDTDAYYIEDEDNKAGQYFRKYSTLWPSEDLQNPPQNLGNHTENIDVLVSDNNVQQCLIARQMLEELMANGITPDSRIAIILGDEKLLQPLLYSLPHELNYNVTMGKKLIEFQLFSFFNHYLQLHENYVVKDKAIYYAATDLISFLQHHAITSLGFNHEVQKFINFLTANNSALVHYDTIKKQLNNVYLQKWLKPQEAINHLLDNYNEIIELLRSHYLEKEDRIAIQVLFELKKIKQQLVNTLGLLSAKYSLNALRQLIRQVAMSTAIPFEGEPLMGVQIMGVLETRCLDFDHIIMLSTNEGILPKGRTENSFIPFIFKEHFNIQTFRDKDAIYAYSFYRLLHKAKTVHYVYNGQTEGHMGGGELSRFVQQLQYELKQKTAYTKDIKNKAVTLLSTKTEHPPFLIEKTPEIIEDIKTYISQKGLSPSAINLYVRSPLDFYFRYIAKIKENALFEQDIELNTFGSIVHENLEEIYKPYCNKALNKALLDQIKQAIPEELPKAARNQFKQGDVTSGINYLYIEGAKTLSEKVVENDMQRIESNKLTVTHLEADLSCVVPMTIHNDEINVVFRGKADRIQKRNDVIEIIDYKTGKVKDNKLNTKSINQIATDTECDKLNQLLCYCLMASRGKIINYDLQQIRPAMQALKSWDKPLAFINKDSNFSLSEDDLDQYLEQINLILSELLNPEIPFAYEDSEDDYNKYQYSSYKDIYV